MQIRRELVIAIFAAASGLASRARVAEAAASAAAPDVPTVRANPKRFDAISAQTVNQEPSDDDLAADDGPGVLRAQVLLDRAHFSSGVLNGRTSQNMEKAVYFFQEENDLTPTGHLDRTTYDKLVDQVGHVDGAIQ